MDRIPAELARLIGSDRISVDPGQLDELSWDALSEARIHPEHRPELHHPVCIVRPQSTEDVRRVIEFANKETISVVPFGGGSGLMGGALSIRPCVALDLRHMNRIIDVDAEARAARVEAGVVLETLDSALSQSGFMLGHDPWTVPVATIGGAISTDSVGYRAGIYGSMGEQVLGLEAVLPDGEILRTRGISKSSAGINLNFLLIGGEGCFGIITEATVRIFPQPEARQLYGIQFQSFEPGFKAIEELFHRRIRPAMVDFGDDEDETGAPLYLVFEGIREIVEAEAKLAVAICIQEGGKLLPPREVESFWRDRHVIARRFMKNRRQRRQRGQDGIFRDWIHVALPASKVLPFRR